MPKPQEYTDTFILIKKWFLVGSEVFKVCQFQSKDPVYRFDLVCKEKKNLILPYVAGLDVFVVDSSNDFH